MNTLKSNEVEYLELIRNNPALRWLVRQPDMEHGRDRLEEYDWIKSKVRAFGRTAHQICGLLVFTWCMFTSIPLIYYVWHFGTAVFLYAVILAIYIIIAVVVSSIFGQFQNDWDNFIRLWVEANWKNRNFQQEVGEILFALLGHHASVFYSHMLEGTREEVENGLVPVHVKDACVRYLINSAKDIKHVGKPQNPFLAILPDHARSALKKSFVVYKRFKIIPEDADLRFYYSQAEKLIELEKAKAAVPV